MLLEIACIIESYHKIIFNTGQVGYYDERCDKICSVKLHLYCFGSTTGVPLRAWLTTTTMMTGATDGDDQVSVAAGQVEDEVQHYMARGTGGPGIGAGRDDGGGGGGGIAAATAR